jgi:predicted DsbA family dithiol-disulfide isomerase
MKKIEMFFDYLCPYCLLGHEQLVEFLQDKPEVEIEWHPCEVRILHGNPPNINSDICIQGMYFSLENDLDIWQYHQKMYDLIHKEKINCENTDTFIEAFADFFDAEAFRVALASGKYNDKVEKANNFAFQETGVHVVPTYRTDGGHLEDRQEFFKMGPSDSAYGGTK